MLLLKYVINKATKRKEKKNKKVIKESNGVKPKKRKTKRVCKIKKKNEKL